MNGPSFICSFIHLFNSFLTLYSGELVAMLGKLWHQPNDIFHIQQRLQRSSQKAVLWVWKGLKFLGCSGTKPQPPFSWTKAILQFSTFIILRKDIFQFFNTYPVSVLMSLRGCATMDKPMTRSYLLFIRFSYILYVLFEFWIEATEAFFYE